MNSKEFSLKIESIVREKRTSYMDAIIDYCKEIDVDVDVDVDFRCEKSGNLVIYAEKLQNNLQILRLERCKRMQIL